METKFYESLYNFDSLIKLILDAFDHHDSLRIEPGSALGRDTMSMTYVRLCAIIEEINSLNSCCRYDEKLKLLMTHLRPFISYAKQYEKGFIEMRNSAYAHFNRDKNGNFRPFWTTIDEIDVPRSEGELRFLCGGLDYVRLVLIANYPGYREFNRQAAESFFEKVNILNSNFVVKQSIDLNQLILATNEMLKADGFVSIR